MNIGSLLTVKGLAHWIMDNGYWDRDSIKLCTDNFSLKKVKLLTQVLLSNFGLVATIHKRISDNKSLC